MAALRHGALVAALFALAACKAIPPDRYGVAQLRFEGVEAFDAAALAACLATRERPSVDVTLGLPGEPHCGEPPFDTHRVRLRLWTWPWTEWPLFDQTLWQKDLERILRWYQARGYPNARVVDTRIEPESATQSDVVEPSTPCRREGSDEGCRVRIRVTIDEGEPVIVRSVHLHVPEGGARATQADGHAALRGARFDEHAYETDKSNLATRLAEAGHCHQSIEGEVRIDRRERWAEVEYWVKPGPVCELGRITVTGYDALPPDTIVRTSRLVMGSRYSPEAIRDAQQAIFALGAFAVVEVSARIPDDGDEVPVDIRVEPAQRNRWLFGGGVQSGLSVTPLDVEGQVASQWDVHLLGRWENRNFLGGMRRLSIEDRPRLIFNQEFPRTDTFEPRQNLGNLLTVELEQPAFLEPRTALLVTGVYDFGPDPFEGFVRHSIRAGLDLSRRFWKQRIHVTAGIHSAAYQIPGRITNVDPTRDQQDWLSTYWQQTFSLDLRDDPVRTTKGAWFGLWLQEAGYGLPADWNYVRVLPEARAYAPLPFGLVLAARFRVGMLLIGQEPSDLTPGSVLQFGPTIHRFRGGGPISNRGFLAQRLGDGEDGGTRLWEANLELRIPVTHDFWIAAFGDAGDVHREPTFRWNYPQVSVGAGLRYYTLVGPIRLDVGFRIPSLQVLGGPDQRFVNYCSDPATGATIACDPESYHGQIFGGPAGAIHLTIGNSF